MGKSYKANSEHTKQHKQANVKQQRKAKQQYKLIGWSE